MSELDDIIISNPHSCDLANFTEIRSQAKRPEQLDGNYMHLFDYIYRVEMSKDDASAWHHFSRLVHYLMKVNKDVYSFGDRI